MRENMHHWSQCPQYYFDDKPERPTRARVTAPIVAGTLERRVGNTKFATKIRLEAYLHKTSEAASRGPSVLERRGRRPVAVLAELLAKESAVRTIQPVPISI